MNRDHLIRTYLNVSTALLDQILTAERTADPESAAATAEILAAGGQLSLTARLAPRTGIALLDVTLLDAAGENPQPLLAIDMQRATAQ